MIRESLKLAVGEADDKLTAVVALGVALSLITKHGLAVQLASCDPRDYARLEQAREALARARLAS